MFSFGTNGAGQVRKTLGALLVWVAIATLAGCATTTKETVSLGEWPKRDGPMVLSGDPERSVAAQDATNADLSEAQWDVLERFAPRGMWDRIRSRKKELQKLRAQVARARPTPEVDPNQPPELPEVPTETLPDGKVQMYYRVRHFGGVDVSANAGNALSRREIKVRPADLKPLAELVKGRLAGKGAVQTVPEDNMLIITCEADSKEFVLEFLARVDCEPLQVEITGQIFEVKHDMDFQAGVRLVVEHMDFTGNQQGWASNFSAEDFAANAAGVFPGNVPDPGSAMRLFQIFGNSGIQATATVQALADVGLAKMIAEPRMTVTLGRTAYMLAGQELPVSDARISNDNIVTEKTRYKPIGVQLYVTPQVVGPDAVKLHVISVVSSVQGFVEFPRLNSLTTPILNPILDTREAETFVSVPDGSALVIGGLRQIKTVTAESKVPGLGDIPVLGWLFKSHRSQKQITDLYFFVTPRIIRHGH
jgi:type II secretory pathway component GspD/PulD (secretin)